MASRSRRAPPSPPAIQSVQGGYRLEPIAPPPGFPTIVDQAGPNRLPLGVALPFPVQRKAEDAGRRRGRRRLAGFVREVVAQQFGLAYQARLAAMTCCIFTEG